MSYGMDSGNQEVYWIRNPAVSACMAGDSAILFDPDTGREKVINPTGVHIWRRLDGMKCPSDIAGAMAGDFEDLPLERVHGDVAEFIDALSNEGFAEKVGARGVQSGSVGLVKDYPDIPYVEDAPKSIDLSLTGRCNLKCVYCFYHDEMAARKDLPAAAWLDFFGELKRLGVRNATVSGGEVFIRPDLWALIDGLIDSRLRYSILSNGTLVDEKTLRAFEKGRRFNRLDSIQVSIDGSCSGVHDKSRGKGSFEKALRGLRLLKEAGFPVAVRVTVNRYNVDDLDNIARLLIDDIGLSSFGTNDAMPMGAGCENQRSIALLPAQQVQAMKTLARLQKQYDGRVTASAGPLAMWRRYREMEHAKASGESPTRWKMGYLTACGCVYSKLAVHHDGAVAPCHILSGLVLGYINENSLADIWKSHSVLKALKERRSISMGEVPGCEECEWAAFCNGSCPGLAYEMAGDFNLANPHDCYRRFLEATGGVEIGYEN